MTYTLIHGDCLDILPTLEAGSVDCIICDPPYGTTACKWDSVVPFEPMWEGIKRVIKRNAAAVLFGSQPFTSALVMSNPKWFRYEWVWEKDSPSNFANAKYVPLTYHEDVAVFYQSAPTYNPQRWNAGRLSNVRSRRETAVNGVYGNSGMIRLPAERTNERYPKSLLCFALPKHNDQEGRFHPTQKPVALLEYLIRTYTNKGETVLDFTMGSGSTGVAALNTGRRFIGIEKDAAYFAIAQERLAAASQQLRLAV